MHHYLFEIREIIDEPEDLDAWIVYQSEANIEGFQSLQELLWDVSFCAEQKVKYY